MRKLGLKAVRSWALQRTATRSCFARAVVWLLLLAALPVSASDKERTGPRTNIELQSARQQVLVQRREDLNAVPHRVRVTLWLIDADGANEKLLYDSSMNQLAPGEQAIRWDVWGLLWSPDGRMLAFIEEKDHSGKGELNTIDVESGERRAFKDAVATGFELAWSGFDQIAFPSTDGGRHCFALADAKTGRVSLNGVPNRLRRLAWSPDSADLLATTDDGLVLIHVNGVKKSWHAEFRNPDLDGAYPPAWSPDGKEIAIVTQRQGGIPDDLDALIDYRLKVITADGGKKRSSRSLHLDPGNIEWSTDGKFIRVGKQVLNATSLVAAGAEDSRAAKFRAIFTLSPDGTKRINWIERADHFEIESVSDRGVPSVLVHGQPVGWRPGPKKSVTYNSKEDAQTMIE